MADIATDGNDVLTGGSGVDTFDGGLGNDIINSGAGSDILDGGSGSDRLNGGSGTDTLIYNLSENTGATDLYTGGSGIDTIRLELTHAQWTDSAVRVQLQNYWQFLQTVKTNASTGEVSNGTASDFVFTFAGGTKLTVQMMEMLDIWVEPASGGDYAPIDYLAALITGPETGTVVEAGGVNNAIVGTPTASGDLYADDLNGADDVFQAVAAGAATTNGYGTYGLSASGVWTYTLNNANSEVQGLNVGGTLTDMFTVLAGDGSSKVVTITISGTNDSPVITSNAAAAAGAVVEAGDLDDGTDVAGTPSASGTLTSSDVDADATATWSGDATGSYGSFAISAGGAWTYTLDNGDNDTQLLKEGQSLTDSFTATVTDDFGATATQLVTITVTGTNDSPVITSATGANEGAVVEAGDLDDGTDVAGTPSASGTLTSSDVDADATATWSGNATGSYGSFAISAGGAWTYTLDNGDNDTQLLKEGQSLTDSFTATVTDDFGATATQVVTITITGTNDVPVISGEATGDRAVKEESDLSASGTLAIVDVDDGESGFTAAGATTTYGSYTLAVNGAWTYTLNNANAIVQALGEGVQITDSFTAVSEDSTASKVVTITITGTADGVVAAVPYTGPGDANDFDALVGSASSGEVLVTGTAGDDTISPAGPGPIDSDATSNNKDVINGFAGNDVINAGEATDRVYGGVGDDVISGGGQADSLYGQAGSDTIHGDDNSDKIYGGSGADFLFGDINSDEIYGGSGIDAIDGGAGADVIVGGYGADILSGGADGDTFRFLSTLDTGDTINDFSGTGGQGDKIDLSAIDANSGTLTNDAFAFAGNTTALSANSLIWFISDNGTAGNTADDFRVVQVDTDGNTATAELQIQITGTTTFVATDFTL